MRSIPFATCAAASLLLAVAAAAAASVACAMSAPGASGLLSSQPLESQQQPSRRAHVIAQYFADPDCSTLTPASMTDAVTTQHAASQHRVSLTGATCTAVGRSGFYELLQPTTSGAPLQKPTDGSASADQCIRVEASKAAGCQGPQWFTIALKCGTCVWDPAVVPTPGYSGTGYLLECGPHHAAAGGLQLFSGCDRLCNKSSCASGPAPIDVSTCYDYVAIKGVEPCNSSHGAPASSLATHVDTTLFADKATCEHAMLTASRATATAGGLRQRAGGAALQDAKQQPSSSAKNDRHDGKKATVTALHGALGTRTFPLQKCVRSAIPEAPFALYREATDDSTIQFVYDLSKLLAS